MAGVALSVLEMVELAEELLAKAAGEYEPWLYDSAASKRLVDAGTRCRRFSASIVGRAARHLEQTVTWKKSEHRSAAD